MHDVSIDYCPRLNVLLLNEIPGGVEKIKQAGIKMADIQELWLSD